MFNQVTSMFIFTLLYLSAYVFYSSKAKQCPADSYYNPKTENCTNCPAGYYRSNCTNSCRYPSYGVECQEECHCSKIACNHVIGCTDYELDGHKDDKNLHLIIGLSVGFGITLVIAAFLVITVANRRFYTRHIRENAHYIGSVVTEHSMTTNMYKPPESNSRHCSESEAADSGVYMLAGTLRYEHINLE